MEQEISGISKFPEKKGNLERWTEIFETIFRKLSVPFDFEPGFPEILVEWNAPIDFFSQAISLGLSPSRSRECFGFGTKSFLTFADL